MSKVSLLRAVLATATAAALAAGGLIAGAAPASAAVTPVDGATAKGRATGSGKWGYVGQFGQLNTSSAATAGQFFLPYGIDVNGRQIAVTDSGRASWESGSKTIGHALQTFTATAVPGSAGHGDYLGNGQYNIVNTKSSVADPGDLVEPVALTSFPVGERRGPRGVAYAPDGRIVGTTYEDSTTAKGQNMVQQYASDALGAAVTSWGNGIYNVTGAAPGAVGVDTDSAGNVFSGHSQGVNINAPDGSFLSSVSGYFDADGVNQTARVQWATHAVDVPREYVKPETMGETYGLSVLDEGDKLVVYVGDAGGYYQPDYKVHYPAGASTAQFTKPASIKRFIVDKSGGTVDARWNPAGWKWTLDTSFGSGGAIQFADNSTFVIFGKVFWQAQAVFGLKADAKSNTLYYSLNGASGARLGAVDLTTGATKLAPAPVNGPSPQQDSAMNYVRGISVDDRGLVYATTQDSTTESTGRAIVQIWGMTPSPVPSATAAPEFASAALTWGASTVGYQQPDLLDYTVKYRATGTTAWSSAPAPAAAATSTETTRTLTGLAPATEYEVCVTPWNEAGSGDPACTTFTTKTPAPSLTVVKTGNGVQTATADDAAHVPAGATVTFAYTVTNTGNVPLTDVQASDDRLGALTPPAGFDGTIPVDGSVAFTASGPVAAGAYSNTVTVTTAELPQSTDAWYGFGETFGLTIVKKGNGAQALTAGDAIHVAAGSEVAFTYEVTNTGNVPASGVTVADDVIDALTPPAGFSGTIAPGETVTFTATGQVPAGAYVNTATADSDGTDPVTTAWHGYGETYGLTIVKKGDDTVATTADTAVHVAADSDVSFVYVVTNVGNVPATEVAVTDDKIAALTPPAGFDGTIPAGGSVQFTGSGPVAAGPYRNTATATSAQSEPVSTQWHGFGDTFGIAIVKTGAAAAAPTAADAVHVNADSQVAFEYTVTNTGNVPASGVTVMDDKIATVTAPQGFDGTLQPGQSAVFTATGAVPAGAYVNTATATSDRTEPVTTAWHGFGDTRTLSIVKAGNDTVATSADAAVHVAAGTSVPFAYTVTNTGDATITGVLVADDKINTLTAPEGFDGTLTPGASVVFTATGTIPAGAYVNTATATGDDTAVATTQWHGFGDVTGLAIVKAGDGIPAPTAGEAVKLAAEKVVGFTYAVTNTGNIAATGVTVSDDKIATLTAPAGFDGTIAPGETVTFTASGAVTGTYRNVATVTADGALTASTEWHAVVDAVTAATPPATTTPPTGLSATGAARIAPWGIAAVVLLLAGGMLVAHRRARRA